MTPEEWEILFPQILDFFDAEIGLNFDLSLQQSIRANLEERLKLLQIAPLAYLPFLAQNQLEAQELINLCTINETYFFREEKQFHVVKDLVFNEIGPDQNHPLILWSAASSTGEEALSLSLLCKRYWPGKFHIYASDINTRALGNFQALSYSDHSLRLDGRSFHHLLDFSQDLNPKKGKNFVLEPSLEIEVLHLNLIKDDFKEKIPHPPQIVFLRNLLIYMNEKNKRLLMDKITALLPEKAFLFLASPETATISHPLLTLREESGVFFFQKSLPSPHFPKESTPINITTQSPSNLHPQTALKHISDCERIMVPKSESGHAKIVTSIHEQIHQGKFDAAEMTLQKIGKKAGSDYLYAYFKGLLQAKKGDQTGSLNFLRQALSFSPDFWPAHYQLALLQESSNPARSLLEWEACLNKMQTQSPAQKEAHLFLFEDFHPSYLEQICRKKIQRLKNIVEGS